MRITEMLARESFADILRQTLSAGWSTQFDTPVRVTADGDGQPWREQRLLSAFFLVPARPEVRRFLNDIFRFTPRRSRQAAQFLLGTVLSSAAGLRWLTGPGFRVTPAVPDADALLVVPGNNRVRVFDFHRRRVRVFLKTGFAVEAMRREIAVRGHGPAGPFPPIVAHDEAAAWFEEPLVDCYALPRLPPWLSRAKAENHAFSLLDNWLGRTVQSGNARDYAPELKLRLTSALRTVTERFPDQVAPFDVWLAKLAEVAGQLADLQTAVGHGDFQAGNILVSRNGQQVQITDWEHSASRLHEYDRMVYGLASRSGVGLGQRMRAFLRGNSQGALASLPKEPEWRKSALAMFVLEDLLWFAQESLGGPFRTPSLGLGHYDQALAEVGGEITSPSP